MTFFDERAQALPTIDEAFMLQRLQSTSHRHPAHVERLPKFFFGGKLLVNLINTRFNLLAQVVADLLVPGSSGFEFHGEGMLRAESLKRRLFRAIQVITSHNLSDVPFSDLPS